jgi:nitroreductase
MKFSIEETNALIRNRRSIYPTSYSDVPVDENIIRDMLANANWAPTHKLTEPWRFVVFQKEGLKKLAKFQSELYKELSTKAGNFDESKFEKLATKPMMASHIIAICMKRNEKELVPAYGVGCYWGSGGVTYKTEANAFFGLGPNDKLLGFMYIGNLKSDKWPVGKRTPFEDKVTWVG